MKHSLFGNRAFLLVLLVLSALEGVAQTTFTVGNLNYRVNNDGVSVTVTGHVNGTNATGGLTLSESVSFGGNDYAVTAIGENAFYGCSSLSGDLVIPNSVVAIGNGAFYYCYGFMGTLTIGDAVTTIGDVAFGYCTYMHGDLVLPNSLTSIGDGAFAYCYGFSGDLIIPNSVITIGESAFQICHGLDGTLTIGDAVTIIGDYAFNDCNGFTGVLTIPSNVKSLGGNTFGYCAFDGIVVASGNQVYDSRNNCNAIITTSTNVLITGCKNTIIPNTVTSIGENAFKGCVGLTSISIPNSITAIGDGAFAFCFDLTGDLTIPNAVSTIGSGAFFQCSGFDGTLTIGASVAFIGDYAFRDCSHFTGAVSLATTPPALGNEWGCVVFERFGYPILTVPYGCATAYQNSNWYDPIGLNGFYEFIETDPNAISETNTPASAVYPNPTNGKSIIEADNIKGICIFNLHGAKVYESTVSGDAFEYDFSKHRAGLYLIKVETSKGVETKRVTVL